MGVSRARWRAGAVATLLVAAVIGASAQDTGAAPSTTPLNCAVPNPPSPCIQYCYVIPDVPSSGQYPCGVGNVPKPTTGTFSYSVPLSAAAQNATGVPGDPGGTGSSSISMNAATNVVCATTSWSGVNSPVVAAHVHGGAYGQPENPAITISLFDPDFINGRTSPASGCGLAAPGVIWAISRCPKQFNVVVHSQQHPVGAIRGQLGTTCNL